MLKNPCKPTRFYYDSHDCNSNGKHILQGGWLTSLEGFAVSVAGLFQHICLPIPKIIFATFRMIYNGV